MSKGDLTGYGKIFKTIVCNNELSYGARTLYSILATYRNMSTNSCFPGTDILCEAMGTTNRTRINDWFLELENAGILRRETRMNTKNGKKIRTIVITDGNEIM